jgi:serine/threonine-protein kinase
MQTQPSPPLALQAPLAGRYTIERELGRGGTATVYLARDVRHGRDVALKVLRPDLAASMGAERFLREIGIAARLAHPNIVPLLDSGEAAGALYFVSAFVPGGSLRDRLARDGPLPLREALRITEEVAEALAYAHAMGIVHRDIKPENILFAGYESDAARPSGRWHALLADFGIARACCGDDGEAITQVGLVVGTPEYMSPEQASGEPEIDGRSDIYSLACVAYEMLAGEPPFHGPSARATMTSHLVDPPPPIRARRPELPEPVERALVRALSKEPGARFATAPDFAAALRAPRGDRQAAAPPRARGIAVLPFVNASPDPDNAFLSEGITDELIVALARVEGLQVASRTSVFALRDRPMDVRAIGALLDCAYVLEGTVRRGGDRLRITAQLTSTSDGRMLWSQAYDRRLDDVLAIQDELARTIVATLRATSFADLEPPPPARHTTSPRAYAHYLRGRYEWNRRTREAIAAAIRHFEDAIAADPRYALAYTGLADSYALHVDYRSVPVAEGFARATAYARRAIELDDSLAEAHTSLAWCLFIHDWRWDEAEREFRRAIELDPRYATAHQWFAFLLSVRGAFDEAIAEGHAATELDPASVSARRSLGYVYYYARRWADARRHLERAIAMNPTAEETYRVLGLVHAVAGEHAEAERALREAVTMPESGSYTRATLAYALARAGRVGEARAILDDLRWEGTRGYVSPVAMATVLIGLGELEEALDWATRSVEERRGWLVYLRVNPLLDPLQGHPRFEELGRRLGL